ncbi:MAG: 50S ribosomal protein L22 [Candidatus Hydrogenedentes bacterium]|nr:50S ribosomal protein L22 [Candidatus Hydrogenedentota bacterium]
MASAEAKLRNLSVSARKARLVADLIRGKRVSDARSILQFTVKLSAEPVLKLLNSAVANMEHEAHLRHLDVDTDEMVVSKVLVNEGRTLYRFQPAPRGRAMRIRKRSSHIELVISEKE